MPLTTFDELLDLEDLGNDCFSAPASPDKGARMFGGQFLAQAIAAGGSTVNGDRSIHSLHAYFLLPGNPHEPVRYVVKRVRDGRSFSHRSIEAFQNDRQLFTMTSSWNVSSDGPKFFGRQAPTVPPVTQSNYSYEQFCRDQMPDPDYERTVRARPMDIRYINPPEERKVSSTAEDQLMWMRISLPMSDCRSSHHAALAYLSDSTVIDHILIPHGKRWQDPDFFGTSLDHAMWFHGTSNATEWLLFEQSVEWTGNGRGLASGRLYTEAGELVATCVQEGLMRFESA